MPRFEPFRAIRYAASMPLDDVIVPPYDVLSDADRAALASRSEYNFVHLDLPLEATGPERYDRAADQMNEWIAAGVLVYDDEPTFTLYRMRFVDEGGTPRETVGVLGGLEVVDEGADGVLPHERTTPKAKTDRLDLTRATRANLSPVWGLSLTPGLTQLLAAPGEPIGSLTVDGVTHSVERVSEPTRLTAICEAVNAHPVVIADGHHRYAISRTYRDEIRAASSSTESDAELTLTYIGELIADQLSIAAIHRLYLGVDADALLTHLADSFDVSPAGIVDGTFASAVVEQGALCAVHADGTGTWLRPKGEAFGGVRNLDGARLEHALASFPHEVTYQHGVEHVQARVASGEAALGVLIRPVHIDEIRRTADEHLLMPPKSTFFTPKLRSGLVIRMMSE